MVPDPIRPCPDRRRVVPSLTATHFVVYRRRSIDCTLLEIRGSFLCELTKPDTFSRVPSHVTWYNIATVQSVYICEPQRLRKSRAAGWLLTLASSGLRHSYSTSSPPNTITAALVRARLPRQNGRDHNRRRRVLVVIAVPLRLLSWLRSSSSLSEHFVGNRDRVQIDQLVRLKAVQRKNPRARCGQDLP